MTATKRLEFRIAADAKARRVLGGALLAEALGRVVAADLAVRFGVVDAIDADAARFYRHYGFRETPVEGRLLRKVRDIAADLQP